MQKFMINKNIKTVNTGPVLLIFPFISGSSVAPEGTGRSKCSQWPSASPGPFMVSECVSPLPPSPPPPAPRHTHPHLWFPLSLLWLSQSPLQFKCKESRSMAMIGKKRNKE